MWRANPSTLALVFVLMGQCYGHLKVGFYKGRCGKTNVKKVVFNVVVRAKFNEDKTVVAKLIRLQFHDCFVRGCDASILLDSRYTEKTALPNANVDGYGIIDKAKKVLEKRCHGIVSCADIIVIAARAAMFLGSSRWYKVETGRRDGSISMVDEALMNIPTPTILMSSAIHVFEQRGLNAEDLVVLLGSHSVGAAHCSNFQYRLYNFRNTRRSDPRMSHSLLWSLKRECPRHGYSTGVAFLDQTPGSELVVDNAFYKSILDGKGILEIDQQLAIDPRTRGIVERLAGNGNEFVNKIGPAMVKLGRVGVLTGRKGEVRRSCRYVNPIF